MSKSNAAAETASGLCWLIAIGMGAYIYLGSSEPPAAAPVVSQEAREAAEAAERQGRREEAIRALAAQEEERRRQEEEAARRRAVDWTKPLYTASITIGCRSAEALAAFQMRAMFDPRAAFPPGCDFVAEGRQVSFPPRRQPQAGNIRVTVQGMAGDWWVSRDDLRN